MGTVFLSKKGKNFAKEEPLAGGGKSDRDKKEASPGDARRSTVLNKCMRTKQKGQGDFFRTTDFLEKPWERTILAPPEGMRLPARPSSPDDRWEWWDGSDHRGFWGEYNLGGQTNSV